MKLCVFFVNVVFLIIMIYILKEAFPVLGYLF